MTRAEMENRRLEAVHDLETVKVGQRVELAKKYGVTRQSIRRWRKRLESGASLRSTPSTGRPKRLTTIQDQSLKIAGERGLTSKAMVQNLSAFQISYSRDHVYRVMQRLGIPLIKRRVA